jgi:hypothetical protein
MCTDRPLPPLKITAAPLLAGSLGFSISKPVPLEARHVCSAQFQQNSCFLAAMLRGQQQVTCRETGDAEHCARADGAVVRSKQTSGTRQHGEKASVKVCEKLLGLKGNQSEITFHNVTNSGVQSSCKQGITQKGLVLTM